MMLLAQCPHNMWTTVREQFKITVHVETTGSSSSIKELITMGAHLAKCTCSSTISSSCFTRNPYFVTLWASFLFDGKF